jgi:hypothetical protein
MAIQNATGPRSSLFVPEVRFTCLFAFSVGNSNYLRLNSLTDTTSHADIFEGTI